MEKIKVFLESDILERYLLEEVTTLEALQVERYIAMYPEVRNAYENLQDNLESFANLYATKTPDNLKNNILSAVRKEKQTTRNFLKYAIAACVVTCMFASVSYFYWNQNQNLIEENSMVSNRIKLLEENMQEQLEDVRNQFIVLNNPQTKKYTIKGNKKARALKAVAYINPIKKLSYINVNKVPHLPKNQCFQMWAEVNGKMLNLGILEAATDSDTLLPLPYGSNAIGYITIEPHGGNINPTVKNIVANITY